MSNSRKPKRPDLSLGAAGRPRPAFIPSQSGHPAPRPPAGRPTGSGPPSLKALEPLYEPVHEWDGQPKFLYLALPEYADTWVDGGPVPINPASCYKSELREGTQTPDEVTQRRSTGADLEDLQGLVKFGSEGTIHNIEFVNSTFNGMQIPYYRFDQHQQDALILCMSNTYDEVIMRTLEKAVGVRISSVADLRECIDAQIGVESQYGPVQYTNTEGKRHHFLKSDSDSWQDEYRLVWVLDDDVEAKTRTIQLPAGLAQRV